MSSIQIVWDYLFALIWGWQGILLAILGLIGAIEWSWGKPIPLSPRLKIAIFLTALFVASFIVYKEQKEELAKLKSEQLTNVENALERQRVFIREKSARELIKYLDSLPPLQKESVIKASYISRWVRWQGKVASVSTVDKKLVVVVSESDGSRPFSSIWFPASLLDKLERLRLGDQISFEGKLQDVGGVGVFVEGVDFVVAGP